MFDLRRFLYGGWFFNLNLLMTLPIRTASRNIETTRLSLRTLKEEDLPALIKLRSDPGVNTHLDRSPDVTDEGIRLFIEKLCENADKQEGEYWAITLKGNDQLIGTICLWNFLPEKKQAETGYELLPEFQGQGFMLEALEAVVDFGFVQLDLQTFEAWPKAANISSIKLLGKAGFVTEGVRLDGYLTFTRNK